MHKFALDPQLAADSIELGHRDACQLRLVNDARYPWLLVIPSDGNYAEWFDLSAPQRRLVDALLVDCAHTIAALPGIQKINLATLGNVVRQLHWHVIGRHAGDAAWPAPIWGRGAAEPYTAEARIAMLAALQRIPGLTRA